MAISRKGRRRIVVGGRVFYWDYRAEGGRPGQGPIWDWPPDGPPLVRVVSEDKRQRLTIALGGGWAGYKVMIEPGRRVVSLAALAPDFERTSTFTPRMVRLLIERCFPH